jgi:hypothetical protein
MLVPRQLQRKVIGYAGISLAESALPLFLSWCRHSSDFVVGVSENALCVVLLQQISTAWAANTTTRSLSAKHPAWIARAAEVIDHLEN